MLTQNLKTWIFILLYVSFIYISLPIARPVLNTFYETLGSFYLSLFINITLTVVFIFMIIKLYQIKEKKIIPYISILGIFVLFIVFSLDRPEERIHFIEYGILGYLIIKAFDNTNLRTIVISSILVFIIGLVDEFIQWLLPNRVGDLRDVAMNTIGGLLGIWFGKALYS